MMLYRHTLRNCCLDSQLTRFWTIFSKLWSFILSSHQHSISLLLQNETSPLHLLIVNNAVQSYGTLPCRKEGGKCWKSVSLVHLVANCIYIALKARACIYTCICLQRHINNDTYLLSRRIHRASHVRRDCMTDMTTPMF